MTRAISVIVPNRNGAATIAMCLEAVLASRCDDFEVVVVDDDSGDDSAKIIERFPCRLVRLERHGGAAKARNVGAQNARGDILFFTDADCLLRPDSLTIARQTLAAAGDNTVVGGTYTPLPHDRRFFSIFQSIFIHYSETRKAHQPDYLATHALAIPARLFRRSGGFREDFLPVLEDVEFTHRLRRMGCRLVMNPAIQVRHVFNYSLSRSLANAFIKAKYWTRYSIGNGDLLADSGTASMQFKFNAAAYFLSALLLSLLPAGGGAFIGTALAGIVALNLYASRELFRAFRDGGGTWFAWGAGAYYVLLYPFAAGIGACAGLVGHLGARPRPDWRNLLALFRHAGSVFWKRRPIHLTFFVTRKCNARCPFCFYLQSTDRPAEVTPDLTLEEIRKVSRSLGRLLWLAFSGGEVYLRKDLVEVSRIFYGQNRPAVMLYSTNGLTPRLIRDRTERILEECRGSVVVVKLSLDGLGADHDALRGTPGAFDRVMSSYSQLAGLLERHPNFELGINTVFCSDNQDRMDEIIDFVQGLEHVGMHTISLVRGNLANARYRSVDYRKYRRATARLEQELKNRATAVYRFRGARLKAAQDILQRRLIHETALRERRLMPCYAGRLNLVLTENGSVYPCEILSDRLGNVRDTNYDLHQILRSERARAAMRAIDDNCCHCTHECYFLTNILFNPRHYPALAKEYLLLRPRRA